MSVDEQKVSAQMNTKSSMTRCQSIFFYAGKIIKVEKHVQIYISRSKKYGFPKSNLKPNIQNGI